MFPASPEAKNFSAETLSTDSSDYDVKMCMHGSEINSEEQKLTPTILLPNNGTEQLILSLVNCVI